MESIHVYKFECSLMSMCVSAGHFAS